MRALGDKVVTVLCLIFFTATAALAVTVGTGNIPGGWVRRIAQSPTDANTLYATSWYVHKSTDGGHSWSAKPYPLPSGTDATQFARHNSWDIAICPDDANTVIVGDENETPVWRTTNGGDSWSPVLLESDSERRMVNMVCFSLTDSNTCFAAGRINPNVNDHRVPYLYMSTDKGAAWSKLSGLQLTANQTIMDAIQVPLGDAHHRILVAVVDQYYAFVGDSTRAASGKIYYSDDSGATFTAASPSWAPYKFTWDPVNQKVWAINSYGNVYNSSDGITWISMGSVDTVFNNGSGPLFFYKIYYKVCGGTPMIFATSSNRGAAASQLVYKTADVTSATPVWVPSSYPGMSDETIDGLIYDIAVDTTDPNGTSWGIGSSNGGYYTTTDSAAHVTQATGINTREVRYGARQGDRIFVNAFDNVIFASTDSALTWRKVMKGSGGSSDYITLHPTDTARVYVTDACAIYTSTCNGESFTMNSPILPGCGGNIKQFTNLLIHPSTTTLMYVGVATMRGATAGHYLFKSENSGTSWTAVTGLTSRGVNMIAFDPKNPDILYASCGSGWGTRPFNGDGDGLYKSTDAAQTWTKLGAGVLDNGYLETIAFNPEDTDTFWAGGVYGDQGNGAMDCIYISTDGGKHFKTQLTDGHTIGTSKIFFFDSSLYYGTSEGYLYKSDDRGQTWGVAMLFPAALEWLIDDSTGTSSSAIRRASSVTGSLYAGGASGMYRVTGMGAASGHAGGYGILGNGGGFGGVSGGGAYTGGEVKSYNYPNPFNPKKGDITTIKFSLPRAVSSVKAKLYSMSAQLVLDGDLGSLSGGNSYTFTWDGRNKDGKLCAPGLYFLMIDADGTRAKHKIVLVY